MKNKKIISSAFPYFDQENIRSIQREIGSTLSSGILTDGPHVKEFEVKFAEYTKVKHAVAVNSGTSALEITLRHFNLKNREVIVPTNTFVATPNSVLFAGGRPVFADISAKTLCIDPEDVKRKITPKTAGVIVVHVAGLVCPQMNELLEICKDHDLFLMEDAAHAHGAMLGEKKAGALANAGCFSFYPTKIMTSGEGGMITTDDSSLAESARSMRSHGQDSQRLMVRLGHNWRMSETTAIIGKHQLDHLEEFVIRRNEIAKHYDSVLEKIENISLFKTPQNMRHSYYKYPLRLSDNIDRENLAIVLRKRFGIETGNIYYPPCHLHPFYRAHFPRNEGNLPVSEKVLKKVLCLPMHVCITQENVEQVSKALSQSISEF